MNHPLQPPHAGAAATPPPRLKDRYRLAQWLGQGSMGLVYRAHDQVLDRDVAVKFLWPKHLSGAEAGERFLREARTVARLTHPNIVTLFDVDREDAWHYLVLEYISGQDLHAHMAAHDGPLSPGEALPIVRGLLAALAYAHANQVVHRDIKPENILLTHEGAVKVADFGLALAQDDVRLTQEDMIVGTTLYLAPEVVAGQRPDQRADLYAAGALCYELLTGQPPFSGDNPMAVFSQILQAPLRPPRSLNQAIPAAVEAIILKLLARDPAERYPSAEAVLAALPQPEPAETEAAETAPGEERTASSRLVRLIRHSTVGPRPAARAPAEPDLFLYAALDDTAEAVEGERRRLAGLLETQVVASLDSLLAQINAYEQLLGANPNARMAISVLASLTRQTIQTARDLGDNLHPTMLETLGLEPALEGLVNQARRSHGLQITLNVQRLGQRLPAKIELALFRAAQDALQWSVQHGHASQLTISLESQAETIRFHLTSNGADQAGLAGLQKAQQRIEQLGGQFQISQSDRDQFALTVQFSLAPPVQLTPRELEVIRLLTEGLSNKEMARLLSVSPRTINFHLDNIYAKLGLNSRTEAAIYALRQGL